MNKNHDFWHQPVTMIGKCFKELEIKALNRLKT